MPGTRKDIATELHRTLKDGPSITAIFINVDAQDECEPFTQLQARFIEQWAREHVRLWLDSWITPVVARLVKEFPAREV